MQSRSPFRAGPPTRASLGEGAARYAPTAVHATSGTGALPKVARLFAPRSRWMVAIASVVLSLGVHQFAFPGLFDKPPEVTLQDLDGELTLPIDLDEDPSPASAAAAANPPDLALAAAAGAGPGVGVDGGTASDAGLVVAHDAAVRAPRDSGPPQDAAFDLDGAVATADMDASARLPGSGGPADPGRLPQTGTFNVMVVVNMAPIRTHPLGGQLGPLLQKIPQWSQFLNGAQLDIVRDLDAIIIYGPSLLHTDRDAILIRYSGPDARIDQAVAAVVASSPAHLASLATLDGGVPAGASLAWLDNGDRAFLRRQPGLVAIVPPDAAGTFAKLPRNAGLDRIKAEQALRFILKRPAQATKIRGLDFPQDMSELRLWVTPRADGSVDVFLEGDFPSAEAAQAAVPKLDALAVGFNVGVAKLAAGWLLDQAKFESVGTRVQTHAVATQQQLEGLLGLANMLL